MDLSTEMDVTDTITAPASSMGPVTPAVNPVTPLADTTPAVDPVVFSANTTPPVDSVYSSDPAQMEVDPITPVADPVSTLHADTTPTLDPVRMCADTSKPMDPVAFSAEATPPLDFVTTPAVDFVTTPAEDPVYSSDASQMEVEGPASLSADDIATTENSYAYSSLPPGLVIKPSSILEDELGVWSTETIAEGVQFGPYQGEVVTDLLDVQNTRYCWEIYEDSTLSHFINACNETKSNWMRFINFAQNKDQQNMASLQVDKEIYYLTQREIPADTELLVWYGEGNNYLNFEVEVQEVDEEPTLFSEPEESKSEPNGKICPYCGKIFRLKGSLKVHLKSHKGEKPFQCESCLASFARKRNLERHMLSHIEPEHAVKKFQCKKCPEQFAKLDNLKAHNLLHKRSYVCNKCNKTMFKPGGILKHILKFHPEDQHDPSVVQLGPFESCPTCGKIYIHKQSFIKHCQKHQQQTESNLKTNQKCVADSEWNTVADPPSRFDETVNDHPKQVLQDNSMHGIGDSYVKLRDINDQSLSTATLEENADSVLQPSKPVNSSPLPLINKENSQIPRTPTELGNTEEAKEKSPVKADAAPLWISCSVCGKVYKSLRDLLQHVKIHTSASVECYRCGKRMCNVRATNKYC